MPTTIDRRLSSLNSSATRPELHESLWILLRRFMALNELRPHELCALFRRPSTGTYGKARTFYDRLDIEAIAPYVGHTPQSIQGIAPRRFELITFDCVLGTAKLCLECAKHGYHSSLHEVDWLHVCPIHSCDLVAHCPQCGRPLSHMSSRRLGDSPRNLPCGHRWTHASILQPPKIDSIPVHSMVNWVARMRCRRSGERWILIQLGQLQAAQHIGCNDSSELNRIVAGIAGYSQTGDRIAASTSSAIRPDWFDVERQKLLRKASRVFEPDRPFWGLANRLHEAVDILAAIGPRDFTSMFGSQLTATDIATGHCYRGSLGRTTIRLLSSVFLQKYIASNSTHWFCVGDFPSFFDTAVRICGQPLGLVRLVGDQSTVYWLR